MHDTTAIHEKHAINVSCLAEKHKPTKWGKGKTMDRESARMLLAKRKDLMKQFNGETCDNCKKGKIFVSAEGWKCSECNASGKNVIDLYINQTGASLNDTLSTLSSVIGEEIDDPETEIYNEQLLEYFKKTAKNKGGIKYLNDLGISEDTATAYLIGYDEEKEAIVFPTRAGAVYHSITGSLAEISSGVFNEKAIYSRSSKIFITYDAMEAAAILEIGYPALSVNSEAGARAAADLISRRKPTGTIILSFKSDLIVDALKQSGAEYYQFDFDILKELKAGKLERSIEQVAESATRPDNISDYLKSKDFLSDCKTYSNVVHTGYKELDSKFNGFRSGDLYTIAAMPALGKTTFVLQMADQIAAAGNDVLFISLEQSKHEIASKSICRTLAQRGTPRSRYDIMDGSRDPVIQDAVQEYIKKTGSRLTVKQGNFGFTANDVIETVKRYIEKTEVRPIVIIDYLQILQPAEQKRGAKESVDDTMTTLKRSARELNVPIVIISSINRTNYLMAVNYESLKESGSIEYSSSVVWGLDLACLTEEKVFFRDKEKNIVEKRERIDAAEKEIPRHVILKCLKNRQGPKDCSVKFNYYPAQDLFVEITGEREKQADIYDDIPEEWKKDIRR